MMISSTIVATMKKPVGEARKRMKQVGNFNLS